MAPPAHLLRPLALTQQCPDLRADTVDRALDARAWRATANWAGIAALRRAPAPNSGGRVPMNFPGCALGRLLGSSSPQWPKWAGALREATMP
eukprot:7704057-Alexandrium_andersonii.AAC.1